MKTTRSRSILFALLALLTSGPLALAANLTIPSYTVSPAPGFADASGHELTDGVLGNPANFNDAPWVAWQNTTPVITFDLGGVASYNGMTIGYMDSTLSAGSTIHAPSAVTISNSTDGVNYTFVATFSGTGTFPRPGGNSRVTSTLSFATATGRYVKLVITRSTQWLFFDEMTIQQASSVPDIAVTQGGSALTDGVSSVNFGIANGSSVLAKTFTITNTGTTNLTALAVGVDGANAADFTVGALGSTDLAAGATTTFDVTFAPAAAGAALAFDGANDSVSVPHNNSLAFSNAFTIESWIYVQSTAESFPTVFSKNGNSLVMWLQGGNASHVWSLAARVQGVQIDGGDVPENTWTHVALTFDGSTASLYVNGASPASASASAPNTGTGPLLLGLWTGEGRPLHGAMDEFRVWNGARTQGQIQSSKDSEISPATPGLGAYYNFNQGFAAGVNSGVTTLLDGTANALHGTLNNFALNGTDSNWIEPGAVGCNTGPEINVLGNSLSILSGDVTPSAADGTDFGAAGSAVSRMFSITNERAGILAVTGIGLGGAAAAEFTVSGLGFPAFIAAGSATNFTVTFQPGAAGARAATLNITNSDCDEALYSFAIQAARPELQAVTAVTGGGAFVFNNQGFTIGYEFTLNQTVTVTGLGFFDQGNDGLATAHPVGLYNSCGALLLSNSVPAGTAAPLTNGFRQVAITPVVLAAGTYRLGAVVFNGGGNDAFRQGVTSVTSDPSLTIGTGKINNGVAVLQFPYQDATLTGLQEKCCFGPNFSFIPGVLPGSSPVAAPEINLTGNGLSIAAGDSTPDVADGTDFGSVSAVSGTITRTFTIVNTGAGSLSVSSLNTSGANAADFTLGALTPASPMAGGGAATFNVVFDPSALGLRTATITISNNVCGQTSYSFAVQGAGGNGAPSVARDNASVTVGEGQFASNTGTYSDPEGNATVVLNASVGSISQNNGAGTWSWSHTVLNGPFGPSTVTITADDGFNAAVTTTFALTATNVAPALAHGANTNLPVHVGMFAREVAFSDPAAGETYSGTVDYGDGSGAQALAIDSLNKTFSLAHTYTNTGTFTVSLALNDGDGGAATDSFTVTVLLNRAPTDLALSASSIAETNVVGATIGALGATDADAGDTHTFTFATGAGDGDNASFAIVGSALQAAVSFNYEAKSNYTVRVRATDAGGLFFERAFAIAILDVNEAPVAFAQSVTNLEDTPFTITLAGSDAEGHALTYSIATNLDAAAGTLGGVVDDTIAFFPATNFHGVASFAFIVNDGAFDSAPATVSITVTPVNDAPVATNQTVTMHEDHSVAITLNGTDVDGDALTWTLLSSPSASAGTLGVLNSNVVTFTPAVNYHGPASFTFRVSDGATNSSVATLTVNVGSVNDPITDLYLSKENVGENRPAGTLVGVIETDDADLDEITVFSFVVGGADNGAFEIVGNQLRTRVAFDYETKHSYSVRVRVRATDAGTPVTFFAERTFVITVTNVAEPSLAVNTSSVSVASGTTANNGGTFAGLAGNAGVSFSANVGSVTKNNAGTWTWSLANATQSRVVTITATEAAGSASVSFAVNVDGSAARLVSNLFDDSAPGSLRYALAQGSGRVEFVKGLQGAIETEGLTLTGQVELVGPGASNVVVQRTGTAVLPLLTVAPGSVASVSGLSFEGGLAANGGAIFNHNGSLAVSACVFTNNSATNQGGAIYSQLDGDNATNVLSISNCVFAANTVTNGGGAIATVTSGSDSQLALLLGGNTFGASDDVATIVNFDGSGAGAFALRTGDTTPSSVLTVNATPGADALAVSAGRIALGGESVQFSGVPSVRLNTGAGADTVALSGATAASILTIDAEGGGGTFTGTTTNDFTGTVHLLHFGAASLNVASNLIGGFTSDGAVQTLNVGGDVRVGAVSAASFATVEIGGALDAEFSTTGLIDDFTVLSVSTNGHITAAQITTATVQGDLNGSVYVSGPGLIDELWVGGSINGEVTAFENFPDDTTGIIGLLNAGAVGTNGVITAGHIEDIQVAGDMAGTVSVGGAGVVDSITVGSMSGRLNALEDLVKSGQVRRESAFDTILRTAIPGSLTYITRNGSDLFQAKPLNNIHTTWGAYRFSSDGRLVWAVGLGTGFNLATITSRDNGASISLIGTTTAGGRKQFTLNGQYSFTIASTLAGTGGKGKAGAAPLVLPVFVAAALVDEDDENSDLIAVGTNYVSRYNGDLTRLVWTKPIPNGVGNDVAVGPNGRIFVAASVKDSSGRPQATILAFDPAGLPAAKVTFPANSGEGLGVNLEGTSQVSLIGKFKGSLTNTALGTRITVVAGRTEDVFTVKLTRALVPVSGTLADLGNAAVASVLQGALNGATTGTPVVGTIKKLNVGNNRLRAQFRLHFNQRLVANAKGGPNAAATPATVSYKIVGRDILKVVTANGVPRIEWKRRLDASVRDINAIAAKPGGNVYVGGEAKAPAGSGQSSVGYIQSWTTTGADVAFALVPGNVGSKSTIISRLKITPSGTIFAALGFSGTFSDRNYTAPTNSGTLLCTVAPSGSTLGLIRIFNKSAPVMDDFDMDASGDVFALFREAQTDVLRIIRINRDTPSEAVLWRTTLQTDRNGYMNRSSLIVGPNGVFVLGTYTSSSTAGLGLRWGSGYVGNKVVLTQPRGMFRVSLTPANGNVVAGNYLGPDVDSVDSGLMSGAIATANLDAGVIKGALTGTLTCAGQGTIGSLEVWGDVSGEISAVQDENEGSGGIGSLIIGGTLSGTIDSASLTNVSIRNVSSNALVLGGLEVVLGEGGIAQNGGRFVELGGAPVALYASVGAITADDTGRWHWTLDGTDGPVANQVVTVAGLDEFGNTQTNLFQITISNLPPTAVFSASATNISLNTVTPPSVGFSAQVDPSPADTSAGFRYAYDFENDGTFEIGDGTYAGGVSAAMQTLPASYFTNAGLLAVRGRIIDKDGGFTDYIVQLAISTPVLAADDCLGAIKNTPLTIPAARLLANDSGAPGLELYVAFVAEFSAQAGIVSLDDTNVIYTPTNNFTGVDTITYTVGDHLGGFATATATVTVLDVTAAQLHRLEITASNSVPVVHFTGLPCTTYQLESATTVNGPWSNLGQFIAPPSGVIEHTSTNPPTGTVFFRMVPPTP